MPDNTYDILEYAKIFCQMDCTVLRQGYETFRQMIFEITNGLDVDDDATIQSLAHDYVLKEGCFDGVFSLSGVPQHYIQKCIVGCRCMTNANKMYHVVGRLDDFDGVALYSSSMSRMPSYLKGKPKVLTNGSKVFLSNVDGYFIRIKILNVRKKRQFPLLSKIDDYGVGIFNNDMIGEVIFIDKTGLEDALTFQSSEYEIIDGYYFDEGRNDKINSVIRHLFETRKQKKKEKGDVRTYSVWTQRL